MKYIENKRLMEFLQKGSNEFGWTIEFLITQMMSACTLLSGGAAYPTLTLETRSLFVEMFRDSQKPFNNLFSSDEILQMIRENRAKGRSPEHIFNLLFGLCRAVDGKLWGSGANAPIS